MNDLVALLQNTITPEIVAALFIMVAFFNRKDKVKFYTAVTFVIIHFFNCLISFEGFNFLYANIFASLSLMLYPSLTSRRDWAWLLGGILLSCICADFYGIYNLQGPEDPIVGIRIDAFKYLTTTAELVVLALMANGWLDKYHIGNIGSDLEYTIRNLFSRSTMFSCLHMGSR